MRRPHLARRLCRFCRRQREESQQPFSDGPGKARFMTLPSSNYHFRQKFLDPVGIAQYSELC